MRKFVYVLIAVLCAYLLTGVAQVRPGERAVVRRFGRVVIPHPAPGLWVGLPWGMDRVDRVPVNFVRRLTVGYEPGIDPDELMPEFDRVMIAQAGIRTRENEAKQDAERVKRTASSEENELKQQADAYAQGRKRLAGAESTAFLGRLEQYQRLKTANPDILT